MSNIISCLTILPDLVVYGSVSVLPAALVLLAAVWWGFSDNLGPGLLNKDWLESNIIPWLSGFPKGEEVTCCYSLPVAEFIWAAWDFSWLSWSGVSHAVSVFLNVWVWGAGVGEMGRGSGRVVNNIATVGCRIMSWLQEYLLSIKFSLILNTI